MSGLSKMLPQLLTIIELIFGMVHPSTFEHLKTQLVFRFLVKRFDPGGLPQ